MAYTYDDQLIEAAEVRRRRLTGALLFGQQRTRRVAPDAARLLLMSVFAAALACAACVAISFVSHLLASDPSLHPGQRTTTTSRPAPSAAR